MNYSKKLYALNKLSNILVAVFGILLFGLLLYNSFFRQLNSFVIVFLLFLFIVFALLAIWTWLIVKRVNYLGYIVGILISCFVIWGGYKVYLVVSLFTNNCGQSKISRLCQHGKNG